MRNQTKRAFYAVILLASMAAMTACNRGYGCPTDLSATVVEQPCTAE